MVDQLTAARQAVGPSIDICADAHARYDYPTGLQVAKRAELPDPRVADVLRLQPCTRRW
jgi:L-alanine-DL-glutamate epimerase-like enolase superfamily enzyme